MTERVAVDLSSLLPAAGGDPAAAVEQAAGSGFGAVHAWALDRHARAYRSALRASGVSAPSGSAAVIDAERPERVFDAAAELGVGLVVDGCTDPARWSSPEAIAQLAARLDDLAASARARGLRFAYRTGRAELGTGLHGTHALHVLVRHLDDDAVLAVDVFSAAAAGANTVLLLQVLGERVVQLHLSDGSFDSPAPRRQPLGAGGLNLTRILAAAPRAARVITLEGSQDSTESDDALAALRRSLHWLRAHDPHLTDQQTDQQTDQHPRGKDPR